jgi:hypothetical protein
MQGRNARDRRLSIIATVVMVVALLVGGVAQVANAAEPPPAPDTGGWDVDVTAPEDRLPIDDAMRAKMREALQSYVATPGLSLSESANARAQLSALGGTNDGTVVAAGQTPEALAVAASAPTSRTLSYTYSAQIKSNYCGPSAAWMIIRQNGVTRSRDDCNRVLTQTNLATFDYLQTDYRGATTWASQSMQYGIQRWMNGAGWGYVQVQSPSSAVVSGALTRVIGTKGKVIAADAVELAGGAHYNNHPNRTIGHWLVGFEYTNSGATVYWADPAIHYFPGAKQEFSYSTSHFTTKFLQHNGVLY